VVALARERDHRLAAFPEESLDMKTDSPLVTVSILNYRRREAMVKTLESVRQQSYSPREVVVVDNGSGDDISAFLKANFPEARLVELSGNPGCAGRNRGVEAARGEMVVTVDNDLYFDSPFELQKIMSAFDESPEASCIAFKVIEAGSGQLHVRDWCHPRSYLEYADKEFETYFIPEGACAFRRKPFLESGGYYEPLWLGHEGWDLALRLLERGGRIFYKPSIRIRHLVSSETRTSWRPYYYYTRNYIWIASRNYPPGRMALFLAEKIAMMACFAARTGHLRAFARGIRDALRGLPETWKTRKAISARTWHRLTNLTSERPGVFARLRRHRERPLI
jgi:GT2 family glycosyltransferase